MAHQFVDAGAAAVIGSHPHVVAEHETYKGAPIYYSLGNFIFDQYFSSAVRRGLLLKLTLNANGIIDVQEIPVVLSKDKTVCPEIGAGMKVNTASSTVGTTSTERIADRQKT